MNSINDSEEILEYLLNNDYINEGDEYELKNTMSGPLTAKDILSQIMDKVNTRLRCKEEYSAKCKAHNQADLFNILNVIPEFEIDQEMYRKLTFRETLVVSHIGDPLGEINTPVGGLCIDVQKAVGKQPQQRQDEDLEQQLLIHLENAGKAAESSFTTHGETKIGFVAPEVVDSATYAVREESLKQQNTYSIGKLVVHVASSFEVEGRNAGSKITSWVDKNLHTLEELRKEYICDPELDQRTLYTALKPRWYYVRQTNSTGKIDERKMYSLQKAKNYISEGGNIILMRYLAIVRYIGTFELACTYINGDLCKNIYECNGPESAMVNNRKLDVCIINRLIIEECGIEHKCYTVLTTEGQIVKQEWEDCDYVCHVNPCARVRNKTPRGNDDILLKEHWHKDMQMMSTFLDQKTLVQLKNKSYLLDHPELKNIIADYVKTILLLKPTEIMEFTTRYFGRFVPEVLPRDEYLDEKFYL